MVRGALDFYERLDFLKPQQPTTTKKKKTISTVCGHEPRKETAKKYSGALRAILVAGEPFDPRGELTDLNKKAAASVYT